MTQRNFIQPAAFLLSALIFVSSASCQAKSDPQSVVEPRSGPGAGQKFLEPFVGEWDVVKTFYSRSGTASRASGTCKQTMIHEGRFLQSEFTFQQGDTKTTGLGLIGFEPATGSFTSVWTDSRATRMSLRQSKDKFDGQQIVLFSKSLSEGTDARSSRTQTRLEENGRKIVHRQYTAGEGGAERLMMELVMTRKGDAPGGK
jgi:Protein of unknown function (DUF1579).